MVELGEVDEAKEQEERDEVERQRLRKIGRNSKKKATQRLRRSECLDDKLALLAPEITERFRVVQGMCEDNTQGLRLPWDQIPNMLRPSSAEEGGLAHNTDRVRRKCWQLESLYVVLRTVIGKMVGKVNATGSPPLHIVDFGSGSGNSMLPLAALLPGCRFTLVDNREMCMTIGRTRVDDAGLSNVAFWHGEIEDYHDSFDIGMATHLCGGATDTAQHKCFLHGAAFILTPCCLGAIKKMITGTSLEHSSTATAAAEHSLGQLSLCEESTDRPAASESKKQEGKKQITSVQKEKEQTELAEGGESRRGGADTGHDPNGDGEEYKENVVRYPRSKWLRGRMDASEYLHLARLSDFNPAKQPRSDERCHTLTHIHAHTYAHPHTQRHTHTHTHTHTHNTMTCHRRAAYVLARELLALDRLTAAQEAGYDTAVGYLWPIEASPKNVVLVGGLQGRGLLGSWLHAKPDTRGP
jgi:2-polyprenyl-3-methyl-5-hydroxy-6-metoxy-1,4-benzoquinol methylase